MSTCACACNAYFLCFSNDSRTKHWKTQGHPTCLTGFLGPDTAQRQQWCILENVMFGKSISLRWQLDARIDTTRATCLEGMHEGQRVPAIFFNTAVLWFCLKWRVRTREKQEET